MLWNSWYHGPVAKSTQLHPWDVTTEEAREIQLRLASEVSRHNAIPERSQRVAGADISPPDSNGIVRASVVVMSLPDLQVTEVEVSMGTPGFPYVPGLLSFREVPLVLEALDQLSVAPDFLLADGQGLAHPRRFGLACHLGLLYGVPAIGCAKSVLVGKHGPLELQKGSWTPLEDKGETVGAALRTRDGVSPIYVSIGHKVDLESAIRWVLACCDGYRMPEPTRLAHLAAAGRPLTPGPRRARLRVSQHAENEKRS